MLTLDGLTLIDFGVAARAADQSQLTRTGMVVGAPAYMSPEQAAGARQLTGAVDVFALGSVVAYAACGRPPFGDDSGHGALYRIVHEEPDLDAVRAVDSGLAEVVAATLDKDPEGRPTAAVLLRRAEEHGPAAPPPWPPAITERLGERAAFAARVPDPDTLKLTAGQWATATAASSSPGAPVPAALCRACTTAPASTNPPAGRPAGATCTSGKATQHWTKIWPPMNAGGPRPRTVGACVVLHLSYSRLASA